MGDIVELQERLRATKRVCVDLDMIENTAEYEDHLINPDGPEAATTISNLQAALTKIAECDYPRPTGKQWRADCKSSKSDQCVHGQFMYESCDNCCSDFARQALEAHHGQ